ncbi:hypothetical protein GCM10010168_86040 [Actinoplanes ianthinogenes]|uniref:Uncharacterized protein n=1 Tax=Actinoplanes ianthinogenes TaxID=122358 RepID=A0ABM7M1A1_9ACTN|nr:hypothetical protein [Actinoplanes ianthinogenes]BCJ45335.1 hypothetical protein Aiant_59920 [Actinoplanes ianthinogenes]GGR53850.1 hypothetical protein GCM10010168_86040 [Actinoplanes ianthinogenes]
MTQTCVRCGASTKDGYVCARPCAQSLAEDLVGAAGHAEDAWTVIARQTRYGGGSRGGSVDASPGDFTASAKLAPIAAAVGGWTRIVAEETGRRPVWRVMAGPLCPPTGQRCAHGSCEALRRREPPPALALELAWLARQVGWLRQHPAADEAFRDLTHACHQLTRLVDRPAEKELVGVCDCGKVLYAVEGRQIIQCPMPTCQLVWDVERSRDILRRHLGDKLVTASEAAKLASYLDADRTQETIRKLIAARVRDGRLVAHGQVLGEPDEDEIAAAAEEDREPEPVVIPLYRFGDVAALLAATPIRRRRESEVAA